MMVGYTVLGEVAATSEPPKPAKHEVKQEPRPEAPKLEPKNDWGPKLTVVQGGLVSILTNLLERAPRQRLAIDDLYRAYATQVKAEDRLSRVKFAEEVAKFCQKIGIRISMVDGKAYLIGVRLVANLQEPAMRWH
jgi:hypothetical protein